MIKTHIFLSTLLLAATAIHAHAQGGSLTPPPGPPTATMKPLDLVEPRIPLVAGSPGVSVNNTTNSIIISQPGSYYLTKNLQITGNAHGIEIQADNVSIDLMGFAIIAPPTGNAGIGIYDLGSNNQVKNGSIRSTTTFDGLNFSPSGFSGGFYNGAAGFNTRVDNLMVKGVITDGIGVSGRNGVVSNCRVEISAGYGISVSGLVYNSSTVSTASNGIFAFLVTNCTAEGAYGVAISGNVVSNSRGSAAGVGANSRGISADVVESSQGFSTNSQGIAAESVHASYGQSTSSSISNNGISATRVVTASYGGSFRGMGIDCQNGMVTASYGTSASTTSTMRGIRGTVVSQCYGESTVTGGGHGIEATRSVTSSYGTTLGLNGIECLGGMVVASYGKTTHNSNASHGIRGAVVVQSYGEAIGSLTGHGILGIRNVTDSYGDSEGFNGIDCQSGTVTSCYGTTDKNLSGVRGIRGAVVSHCYGSASGTEGGNGIEGIYSVTASYGQSAGRVGIFSAAGTVSDSFGLTSGGIAAAMGINAQIVTNSRGSSSNTFGGEGILANTLAMNSAGVSSGSHGMSVTRSAQNCYGFTSATSTSAHGIFSAEGSLTNCWGWSNGTGGGSGIHARIVTGSTGYAAANALHGINARIVHTSYGHRASSVGGKFGLRAAQAHFSEAVNGQEITTAAP